MSNVLTLIRAGGRSLAAVELTRSNAASSKAASSKTEISIACQPLNRPDKVAERLVHQHQLMYRILLKASRRLRCSPSGSQTQVDNDVPADRGLTPQATMKPGPLNRFFTTALRSRSRSAHMLNSRNPHRSFDLFNLEHQIKDLTP